jgi:Carboxypeptidase regulatory-like domain
MFVKSSRMRRAVLAVVLLTRLASAASIPGIVVEHFSGRPLARAEVKLAALGAPGTAGGEIKIRANTVGQFLFSGLSVGAYLLTASRTGFAELRYGQKTWKAAGAPIVLAEPERHYVAELRLRRLGAVAGIVWDENQVGLPEQDVIVYEATRPPKMAARGRPTIEASTESEGSSRAVTTCGRAAE